MEFVIFVYGFYFFIVIQFVIRNRKEEFDNNNFKLNPSFLNFCHELFMAKIPFYQKLDAANQLKFNYRVHEFIVSKEWKGFYDFEVHSEHRALIAACGVQLTFGLREYKLDHIKRIFICPTVFYSRLFERDVKGLTMFNAIYLSWEDCEKGMDVSDDAYNLCLHEFAHALDMTITVGGADIDNNYAKFLYAWEEESDRVFELINQDSGHVSFLREYAKVNKHEFFAVCVEHFFERPQSFNDADAHLYTSLCYLLNCNPLNTAENFALVKPNKIIDKVGRNYKINMPYRLVTALVLGTLLIIMVVPFGDRFFSCLGIAFGGTYFIYSLMQSDEAIFTSEYLIKMTGIYVLGVMPLIATIVNLVIMANA